jgi:tetratricopeptide (TPR) repeat protein
MLFQAVQSLELAQVARLYTETELQQNYQQNAQLLKNSVEDQRRDVDFTQSQNINKSKQQGQEKILAIIRDVENSAKDLLQRAGLVELIDSQAEPVDESIIAQSSDQVIVEHLVNSQAAFVATRAALLRLGRAFLAAGQYEKAQQLVQPLIKDNQAPLYNDARELICEAYMGLVHTAIDLNNKEDAIRIAKRGLSLKPDNKFSKELLSYASLKPKDWRLIWKTYITFPVGNGFSVNGANFRIKFSRDSSLIAIAYDYRSGRIGSSNRYWGQGISVIDRASMQGIFHIPFAVDVSDDDYYGSNKKPHQNIYLIEFTEDDNFIEIYQQGGEKQKLDLLHGIISPGEDDHRINARDQYSIEQQFLKQLNEKIESGYGTAFQAGFQSYDDNWIAAVDVHCRLYLFQGEW